MIEFRSILSYDCSLSQSGATYLNLHLSLRFDLSNTGWNLGFLFIRLVPLSSKNWFFKIIFYMNSSQDRIIDGFNSAVLFLCLRVASSETIYQFCKKEKKKSYLYPFNDWTIFEVFGSKSSIISYLSLCSEKFGN